jgi:hypothetical protein
MRFIRLLLQGSLLVAVAWTALFAAQSPPVPGWKSYSNGRFGFLIQYPPDWRLGASLSDGLGITIHAPHPGSQVALSGFLNTAVGTSQDGRQTLQEFASAHRRIIDDVYAKKNISVKWEPEHSITLGGRTAQQLTFSYLGETNTRIIEMHIFSLGRNEGRGVRIRFPAEHRKALMPIISEMLQTYQPGRDQDAVSPFVPAPR